MTPTQLALEILHAQLTVAACISREFGAAAKGATCSAPIASQYSATPDPGSACAKWRMADNKIVMRCLPGQTCVDSSSPSRIQALSKATSKPFQALKWRSNGWPSTKTRLPVSADFCNRARLQAPAGLGAIAHCVPVPGPGLAPAHRAAANSAWLLRQGRFVAFERGRRGHRRNCPGKRFVAPLRGHLTSSAGRCGSSAPVHGKAPGGRRPRPAAARKSAR